MGHADHAARGGAVALVRDLDGEVAGLAEADAAGAMSSISSAHCDRGALAARRDLGEAVAGRAQRREASRPGRVAVPWKTNCRRGPRGDLGQRRWCSGCRGSCPRATSSVTMTLRIRPWPAFVTVPDDLDRAGRRRRCPGSHTAGDREAPAHAPSTAHAHWVVPAPWALDDGPRERLRALGDRGEADGLLGRRAGRDRAQREREHGAVGDLEARGRRRGERHLARVGASPVLSTVKTTSTGSFQLHVGGRDARSGTRASTFCHVLLDDLAARALGVLERPSRREAHAVRAAGARSCCAA